MHFLLEWSHVLLPPEVLQASLAKVEISAQSEISVCVTGNYRHYLLTVPDFGIT